MKPTKNNHLIDINNFAEWLSTESSYLPPGKHDWLPDYQLIRLLHLLTEIEEFVSKVLKSNKPAFEFKYRKTGNCDLPPLKTIKHLTLAKYFQKVIEWFGEYDPGYRYSPNAQLFFSSCASLPLHREWFSDPKRNAATPGYKAYEMFNGLVDLIRIKARSPEFKRVSYDLEYNAAKLYQGAEDYIRRLFKKHDRLLVIRVDFHYTEEHAGLVTVEKCKRDFARFLNNRRHNKEISKDLAGYIWSLEYAPAKGYHYHCLFFFNGRNVQNDHYWGMRLGEYWEQTVPNGQYWNVNTEENKSEYDRKGILGIGKIHRYDEEKIQNLLYIVRYMSKIEQYLLYRPLAGLKLFGKGRYKVHR